MTPDSDLRELEGLVEKATPGPWEAEDNGNRGSWIRSCSTREWAALSCGDTDEHGQANAALIVAAVNALPSLIADLREARERQVWQPIESAPKDGTPILAWCVHPHARWATDSKEWACAVVTQWIKHNGGGWTWNGMAGSFTHWMPLPDAPARIKELEGKT